MKKLHSSQIKALQKDDKLIPLFNKQPISPIFKFGVKTEAWFIHTCMYYLLIHLYKYHAYERKNVYAIYFRKSLESRHASREVI